MAAEVIRAPLVIGFGNSLRSDDGAGLAVAERLAHAAPFLTVRLCQQLSPEWTTEIAQASAVLFIDAVQAQADNQEPSLVAIARAALEAPAAAGRFSHSLPPDHLLALTLALHPQCPPGWQLLIPGHLWHVGDVFSPATAKACRQALPLALHWVASHA